MASTKQSSLVNLGMGAAGEGAGREERNKGKNGIRVICTWQEHLVKEEVQCVFLRSVYERDLHTRAFVGPVGYLLNLMVCFVSLDRLCMCFIW